MDSGLAPSGAARKDGREYATSGCQTRTIRARSLHPCHHREPLDALIAVGVEEGVVIPERDAAVGIAVGSEHEAVREQAAAAIDRVLAADRGQPQRRHAVKQRLARL